MKLSEATVNQTYQIKEITSSEKLKNHLQELGIVKGQPVVLLQMNGGNGIVLLKNSRLALDVSIIEAIGVEESQEQKIWTTLEQLGIGEQAKVLTIHGEGPLRRRLMDMGLTKNVVVTVIKLAPLGDPIEINLRGYQLSLRKNEAAYVVVEKVEKNEGV